MAGGLFFIDEKQPSGDYELLKIPVPNGQISGQTTTNGMCNVIEEDDEAEREGRILFTGLDHSLTIAHSDAKYFIVSGGDMDK